MIFTLSRLISASKLSLQPVRYYRLPPNLTSFLDDYSREYKNNQNATVIESYKSIKSKVSEYEELRSFIDTSTDKELVEIAELDMESISEFIDNEVNVIKEELIVPAKYDAEDAAAGGQATRDDDVHGMSERSGADGAPRRKRTERQEAMRVDGAKVMRAMMAHSKRLLIRGRIPDGLLCAAHFFLLE